jgi:tRNA(Ile)-lysidine synthetase-like protein
MQKAKTPMPKSTSNSPKKSTKKSTSSQKEVDSAVEAVAKSTAVKSSKPKVSKPTTATKKVAPTSQKVVPESSSEKKVSKSKTVKTPEKKSGKAPATPKEKSTSSEVKPEKRVVSETESVQSVVLNELKKQLSLAGLVGMGRSPRVILAISGGADSTALLHALSQLKSTKGLECLAVYYHHNWRGTPPPELARVHKNCQRLRIPLVFAPPHPDEEKSELSARQYRYERLLDIATQFRAEAILTAHHQDDQIETLLFRIFRGTGLDGLEGIQRCLFFRKQQDESPSHIPILRPFLDLSVSTLEAYNKVNDLLYLDRKSVV